ncbi:MAG: T9SS type A sorting domain-containing protein [Bacteroidota bacterium]
MNFLRKSNFLLMGFALVSAIAKGQTTYYAVANGNVSTPGVWSTSRGGIPCSGGCTFTNFDDYIIGDGFTVTISGNRNVSDITVENTGRLEWSGDFQLRFNLNGADDPSLTVETGGVVFDNNNANAQIRSITSFQNLSIDVDGSLEIADFQFRGGGANVTFESASGTILIRDQLSFRGGGLHTLINEHSNLQVGTILCEAPNGTTPQTATVTNNGTITATNFNFNSAPGIDDMTLTTNGTGVLSVANAINARPASLTWTNTQTFNANGGINFTTASGNHTITNNGTFRPTNVTVSGAGTQITWGGSGSTDITTSLSFGGDNITFTNDQVGTFEMTNLLFPNDGMGFTNNGSLQAQNLTVSGTAVVVTWGGTGTLDVGTLMNLNGANASFTNNQTGNFDVWNLQYGASGVTFTNNGTFSTTETPDVEEHIYFAPGADNSTQVNNGTMTCDEILIQSDDVRIENYGTFNIDLELDEEDVNNCTLVNGTTSNHTATVNFTDTADPGNAGGFDIENTMRVENHGVINQPGDFQGDETKAQFTLYNYDGATWNFGGIAERGSGGSGHTETLAMVDLFTNYATNTFNYNGSGNQTVLDPDDNTYYNLTVSNSGTKTAAGPFDIGTSTTNLGSVTVADDASYVLAGTMNIYGDVSITDNAQFSAGTSFLNMRGGAGRSWTSTSSVGFSAGTGRVALFGPSHYTLTDASGAVFYDFRIRNGSSFTISSGSSMTINGLTEFDNGIIYGSSTALVTFGASSTINGGVGGDSDSYVDGPVRKIGNTAFVFPLGDGSVWAPAELLATNGAATDEYTAQYFASPAPNSSNLPGSGIAHVSDNEYWEISHSGTATSTDIALHWKDGINHSDISDLGSDLLITHYNSVSSEWETVGNSAQGGSTTTTGSIQALGVTSFSPFTLGSATGTNTLGVSVLPVEFLDFHASKLGDEVSLRWSTAAEVDNDFFTVERSADGMDFEALGNVAGAGNSSTIQYYEFVDDYPLFGTNYYRIKQTDFDGSFEHSKAIVMQSIGNVGALQLSPNPTTDGRVVLTIRGLAQSEDFALSLLDVSGNVALINQVTIAPNTPFVLDLRTADLPRGVYLLNLRSSDRMLSRRMIFK